MNWYVLNLESLRKTAGFKQIAEERNPNFESHRWNSIANMTKFLDFHKFHKNLLESSWNFLTFLINFIWKPTFISFNQGIVWIHFRRQYDNTLQVWRLLWYIVVTCNILQFPSQSSHCEADIYGRYFMSWHDTSRHNAHFSLIRICQIQPLAQSSLLKNLTSWTQSIFS